MKTQPNNRVKLVAVSLAGTTIRIDPASIAKDQRRILHGDFKGTQVNSPAIYPVGESVILWPDASKSFAVSIGRAELGVLSTKFLESEGLTVTQK